jgi:SNF2 family DNA or RNA helicase
MKHYIGDICLPIDPAFHNAPGAFNPNSDYQQQQGAFFTDELGRMNSQGQPVGNLPNMYNRLRVMKSRCPALGVMWQSLLYYSDKYHEGLRLTPDFPEPRCINNKRLRWTKTIAYSRMMLILEFHGLERTPDMGREFICSLPRVLKDSEHPELAKKLPDLLLPLFKQYNRPNTHMRKKKREWLDACASVFTMRDAEIVSYDGRGWSGNYFRVKLYMSDMIFKNGRSMAAESMNWLHLKNIINAVRMGDELFTHFPECLTHKCEGLPEPATPSMANHGIAYYDHYNQLTLVEWGKIFLEWSHRRNVTATVTTPDLYEHQASILEWMKEKEARAGCGEGWHKMVLASGFVMYQHELGNIINQDMYDQYISKKPSGGIIAQAVGSGKTKEMLYLIRDQIDRLRKTLVVLPTTMISTWEDECCKWTPELKVNVYYGNRRKIPLDDDSDIVITTYRTVCSELSTNSANIKHQDLGRCRWDRIILDEGHHIRDMGSRTFKAINNIKICDSGSKWIITATPIIKSVVDMCSYLAFLRVYPWVTLDNLPHHSYISRSISSIMYALSSYSETYPSIAEAVRKQIKMTMFYQSKKTVAEISDLKPASIKDVTITIPSDESHANLMKILRQQIDDRVKNDPTANNYSQRLKWMSWLRFCAFNPAMVPTAAYGRPMTKTSEAGMPVIMTSAESLNLPNVPEQFQKSVKNTLEDLDNQRCPVCLDTIDTPTITACGHIFCFECINNAFIHQQTARKKCPCCRKDLQNSVLREIKMEDSVSGTDKDFSIVEHPMVGATEVLNTTLEELKKWRDVRSPKVKRLVEWFQSTDEKCLIFTSLSGVVLTDIQQALQEANIKHVVVSGSMTRNQRARAIDTFQNDTTCRAFLLTTRSASYGLTLTAASSIIFFEPCMNRSLRDQCIGRMDRIGQKKNSLDVITFAVEGSIEEKLAEVVKVKNWSFKDVNL